MKMIEMMVLWHINTCESGKEEKLKSQSQYIGE